MGVWPALAALLAASPLAGQQQGGSAGAAPTRLRPASTGAAWSQYADPQTAATSFRVRRATQQTVSVAAVRILSACLRALLGLRMQT